MSHIFSLRQGIESGLSEDKLLEYVPIPEILSPGGILTKKESTSCSSSVINASPRSQHGIGYNDKEPFKFHAKFTRRFIEMDDEMVSVMSGTDLIHLIYSNIFCSPNRVRCPD